jgi:DNA-directed RNA polymerase subunit alpha
MAHKNLLTNFKRPAPRNIQYQVINSNETYGQIVAFPFERGYAVTVANSLRRVMLSSLPGYAITGLSVKFSDKSGSLQMLLSSFDNIYGVYEDTMQIIQNLKKVRLSLNDSSDERKIMLDFSGEREITAKDLAVDKNITVYNKDFSIAKLNKDAKIQMEITVSFGRGYIPANLIQQNSTEVGFIAIDGLFSPVEKVIFQVDNYRIDQKIDYEQFSLDVWTDGSISVADAVADAAKILKEHFAAFINFNEEDYDSKEEFTREDSNSPEEEKLFRLMKIPIEELELNARAFNCLVSVGISHVGDVLLKPKDELERTKNLGQKSLDEIKMKLKKLELYLEMNIPQIVIDKFLNYKASLLEAPDED